MTNNAIRDVEILVVDDDIELAETLRDFLVGEGHTVATANSASSALDFYEHNPQLALALLDLMMPQSSGLAVMQELHRRNPDLPVVIMTGFGTIETAVEAIKGGAEDYITKPFDRDAVPHDIELHDVSCLRRKALGLAAVFQNGQLASARLRGFRRSLQRIVEQALLEAGQDVGLPLAPEQLESGLDRMTQPVPERVRHALHLLLARPVREPDLSLA